MNALPPLVAAYSERACAGRPEAPAAVTVVQQGVMRMKPNGRRLSFTARETFRVSEPAFAWTARFPFVPGLWLQIDDGYARGEGELRGRLWGRVPLFRTSGPETTRGELQRYLAELFWVPHAIASNPSLVWSEASANACTVACSIEPDAAVRFEFDEAGDIAAITATRPRQDGKRFVMTPWRGVVHDYTVFDGVRIPARAEVSWLIGDETFTYWEGRVTSLEFAA